MPNVTLHFYAANDLNGPVLLELTDDDDFVKNIELKVAQSELGGGSFVLARKVGFPLFGSGDVDPDVLVRVLVHAYSDTEYFWGFLIQKRAEVLIGEEGTEEFQFGGPGPKQYLERGGLSIEQYTGAGNWNIDLEAGVFRWNEDATAGRVLNRVIAEDAANPASGCSDLTRSFTAALDSDGNAWTGLVTEAGAEDFELPIGNSILKTLWELEDGADIESRIYLGTVADPVFRLDALPVIGTDYATAGTDYAVDSLRLLEAGPDYPHGNIGSLGGKHNLTVEGDSERKTTHVNVKGKDGAWAVAVRDSWSPGDYVKWDTISYPNSSRTGFLELVGKRWLRRQELASEEITIPIIPGDAPEDGRYFPDPEGLLWIGNTAAIHTGPATGFSPVDYRNAQLRVTRIDLNLIEASDDTSALTRAMSWTVEVSFNTDRGGSHSPRQGTTGRNTVAVGPKPCRPAVLEPLESLGEVGSACSNSGTNPASDYAPWAGDNEERVEITSAITVPVGSTLMAVVQDMDEGHSGYEHTVYDEQGNTWELDLTTPAQGTSGRRGHIYRAIVTEQIEIGDYIRFAFNLGASLVSSTETGGRCIAVHAFSSVLVVNEAGVTASGFNGTAALASSGEGDISVAVVAVHDDTVGGVTPDADWEIIDTYVQVNGSGNTVGGVLGQYLIPGAGDALTVSIDQSRDWSAGSVGYLSNAFSAVRDGHPDLVGTSKRWARCDHRDEVDRDAPPTVNDDWATAGYKLGTLWFEWDDLGTPTEILHVYKLIDASTGAAVWIELPGGSVTEITDLPTAETDTDLVLHPDGAGGVEWGADATGGGGALASARYVRTAGDYTLTGGTSSTVFSNVDGTNLSLTITTAARRVLVVFQGTARVNNVAGGMFFDIEIDGTRVGGATAGLIIVQQAVSAEFMNVSFSYLTDVLSAGSHTFKLQWMQSNIAHTVTLSGSDPKMMFGVQEQG